MASRRDGKGKSQLLSHATTLFSLQVVGAVAWLGYTVLLARALELAEFAQVIYTINVAILASLLIGLGKDVALLRIVAQNNTPSRMAALRRTLRDSQMTVIVVGVALSVVLAAAAHAGLQTPVTQSVPVALLCGAICTLTATMTLNQYFLRGIGRVWQSQIGFSLIRTVLPALVTYLWSLLGPVTALSAMGIFLSSLAVATLLEAMFIADATRESKNTAIQEEIDLSVAKDAYRVWPGNIANAIQMRAGGLVVGLLVQPEIAAVFLAAERFSNAAHFSIAAVNNAAAPAIASSARSGTRALQSTLRQTSQVMFIAAAAGAALTVLVGLVGFRLLGSAFEAGMPILLILLAAPLSWSIFGLGQVALQNLGYFAAFSWVACVSALLAVLIIAWATSVFGPIGAAIAFGVTWWAANVAFVMRLFSVAGKDIGGSALVIARKRSHARRGAE